MLLVACLGVHPIQDSEVIKGVLEAFDKIGENETV